MEVNLEDVIIRNFVFRFWNTLKEKTKVTKQAPAGEVPIENSGTNDMHHGFISRYSEPAYKVVARNTRSIEGARR